MLEKKSNPQGYLYCDGSTFDSTAYPALYQYLGSNVLPDFREFSPVGAEQNTTNVYDASTNPTGVIHDHDVYTEGESKDDQLQQHGHWSNPVTGELTTALGQNGNGGYSTGTNVAGARAGTVTRGKRKAVFVYIKATSGLTENQQENVLNTINENLSYSTTEHKTGKKWIDGKPTYEKTVPILSTVAHDEWSLAGYQNASALFGSNVDTLVNALIVGELLMPTIADKTRGLFTRGFNITTGSISLEYTKTTD
jgi:hypothetical protein